VQLLEDRSISSQELDYMYMYKYGLSVPQALELLGCGSSLNDFIDGHKTLSMKDGIISVTRNEVAVEKPAVMLEMPPGLAQVMEKLVVVISLTMVTPALPVHNKKFDDIEKDEFPPVRLTIRGDDTVSSVKERAAAAELIPYQDSDLLYNSNKLDEQMQIADVGIEDGSTLEFIVRASETDFVGQLTELLQMKPRTSQDLSLRYNCKYGTTVQRAMKLVGVTDRFVEFVRRQPCFRVQGGCVSLHIQRPPGIDESEQMLERMMASIVQASFFNVVRHTARFAPKGDSTIEATLFLSGLDGVSKGVWLPTVLRATATSLKDNLPWAMTAIVGEAVRVRFDKNVSVDVRFASACGAM